MSKKKKSNRQIMKAYKFYLSGSPVSEAAKSIGISRQMLWNYFKEKGLQLKGRCSREKVSYKGERYSFDKYGYLKKTTGNREYLHRKIYRDKKGEIPKGYCVFHINGDKTNCSIENLDIETISENVKRRGFKNNQFTKSLSEDL